MDERTIAAIGQGVAPAPSAVGGLIADLGSRQVVDESGGYRGNVRWPTDDDLATAIRYDRSYGDRSAGFFNPGGATALTLSMESAPRAINRARWSRLERARRLRRKWQISSIANGWLPVKVRQPPSDLIRGI